MTLLHRWLAGLFICIGCALAVQPFTFGLGARRPLPPVQFRPLLIARNPFVPPRRYALEARRLAQAKAVAAPALSSQAGAALLQAPSSIIVFAGRHPFAMVPGRVRPLYIGDRYDGSTVRDIVPLGIVLENGQVVSSETSAYAGRTNGLTSPGSTIPPVFAPASPIPTPALPAPSPTPRPSPLGYPGGAYSNPANTSPYGGSLATP